MAEKKFQVVFDCETEGCDHEAIESEHDDYDAAKKQAEALANLGNSVWAKCPHCGKARKYFPGAMTKTPPYVLDTEAAQTELGRFLDNESAD